MPCMAVQWYGHIPLHPYYAGTEPVGFSPTKQTSLAPSSLIVVNCRASRMKSELYPTKNRFKADLLAYEWRGVELHNQHRKAIILCRGIGNTDAVRSMLT